MWLGFPAVLLFVLLLIGGIIGGGIFTIVLVPVAFVVAIAAVTFAVWSRAQQGSGGRSHAAQTGDPLPHSEHHNVAASPNAPGDLVDARRHQQ
jgi:hypothetical protein